MSSRQADLEWQLETARTLCAAFDNQIEMEEVLRLLREKENVDGVVDAMLVLSREKSPKNSTVATEPQVAEVVQPSNLIYIEPLSNKELEQPVAVPPTGNPLALFVTSLFDPNVPNASQKDEEEHKEQPKVEEVKSEPPMMQSLLSASSFDLGSLSQSMMTAIHSIAKTADEKNVQTDDNDVKFFHERIDSLSKQLSQAMEAKTRVEGEKKNALKFCVEQVERMKENIKEKEEVIAKQEEEIQQLRKQLEEAKSESKFEKYVVDSKAMLMQGVESLSQQINENIAKVQTEFRNDEKEWVVVKRLQEFASELKKEIMELFKNPLPPQAPVAVVQPTSSDPPKKDTDKVGHEEEKLLWQVERASLESYIKELEQKVKYYEEEEQARSVSSMENSALTNLSSSVLDGSSLTVDSNNDQTFQASNTVAPPQQPQPPQMMFAPPMYPPVYSHPYWAPRNFAPPPNSYPYQMPPPNPTYPNYPRRY